MLTLAFAIYFLVGAGIAAATAVDFERSGDAIARKAGIGVIFLGSLLTAIVWPFFVPAVINATRFGSASHNRNERRGT